MAITEQGFTVPDGVTGDLVVFTTNEEGKTEVVLIDRKNTPYGKALPGGFLDPWETLEQCAVREFFEECGVNLGDDAVPILVGVYSDPKRDPRARIIATAFYVVVLKEKLSHLVAKDDALSVRLYPLDQIVNGGVQLAFPDHQHMIQEAYKKYKSS